MPLKPGTRLGPYEILAQLGAGGMGEVYKARDTRLERFVAIKVLPDHLADDPELRERFEREARTIAQLNHPHICTLHDIGSQDDTDFLVMEYLEGETLAERLKKGPLPLDQVLRYAVEVSDALDKAHRAGVTHRDIKPGNIVVTKAGTKLLDFGLAKLKQDIFRATTPASEMPTVPGALTEHGTLLGTLHYMAPEQVEGKVDQIDARSDIFAFGALVYEMATGKRAFPGETQASVIAKILEVDPPPMSTLQPMSPPSLDRVVKTCLAKDQEDRWQSMRDVCRELKWTAESGGQTNLSPVTAISRPGVPRIGVMVTVLACLLLGAVGGVTLWNSRSSSSPPLVTRTVVPLPETDRLTVPATPAIAVSPDGRLLVYAATSANHIQQLYLRAMDSLEARPMSGTEGANTPFFSPDGQWVGFFSGGKLKKVPVTGGAVLTLGEAGGLSRGAVWAPNDTIIFAPSTNSGLFVIPAVGGKPKSLTKPDSSKGELSHRWPTLLPGGKTVIFSAGSGGAYGIRGQIVAQKLDTGERRVLIEAGSYARYVPTGHIVYHRQGNLIAVPFDLNRLETTGTPFPIVEGVLGSTATGAAQYALSDLGSLLYVPGVAGQEIRLQLVWVDRKGTVQPLRAPPGPYADPRLSPDGQRVAVANQDVNLDVWVYELARETLTRLTFDPNGDETPVWSPDGKDLALARTGQGMNILRRLADGSGMEEILLPISEHAHIGSWSPDGQALALEWQHSETGSDIWILPLEGDRKPKPFLETSFNELDPAFSPDGRWLAYQSDESGRNEVYVQPYPGPGGKWQISTEGGSEPVWARNGRELFYRNGSRMMTVDVTQNLDSNRAGSFSASTPMVLFEGQFENPANRTSYDVSPDGQHFLMLKASEEQPATTQINVVLNWFEELKRRVPAGP